MRPWDLKKPKQHTTHWTTHGWAGTCVRGCQPHSLEGAIVKHIQSLGSYEHSFFHYETDGHFIQEDTYKDNPSLFMHKWGILHGTLEFRCKPGRRLWDPMTWGLIRKLRISYRKSKKIAFCGSWDLYLLICMFSLPPCISHRTKSEMIIGMYIQICAQYLNCSLFFTWIPSIHPHLSSLALNLYP